MNTRELEKTSIIEIANSLCVPFTMFYEYKTPAGNTELHLPFYGSAWEGHESTWQKECLARMNGVKEIPANEHKMACSVNECIRNDDIDSLTNLIDTWKKNKDLTFNEREIILHADLFVRELLKRGA